MSVATAVFSRSRLLVSVAVFVRRVFRLRRRGALRAAHSCRGIAFFCRCRSTVSVAVFACRVRRLRRRGALRATHSCRGVAVLYGRRTPAAASRFFAGAGQWCPLPRTACPSRNVSKRAKSLLSILDIAVIDFCVVQYTQSPIRGKLPRTRLFFPRCARRVCPGNTAVFPAFLSRSCARKRGRFSA